MQLFQRNAIIEKISALHIKKEANSKLNFVLQQNQGITYYQSKLMLSDKENPSDLQTPSRYVIYFEENADLIIILSAKQSNLQSQGQLEKVLLIFWPNIASAVCQSFRFLIMKKYI